MWRQVMSPGQVSKPALLGSPRLRRLFVRICDAVVPCYQRNSKRLLLAPRLSLCYYIDETGL